MTIFAISIAVIICIGLPVSGLIITSKELNRREADYQLLRKHYNENFFRLEELEKTHDSMRLRGDLWEGKYGKLKVDYKKLEEKYDDIVKASDEYHRCAGELFTRRDIDGLAEMLNVAKWEFKKL